MAAHYFDYLLVGELTAIVAAALLLQKWWYGLVASAILTALWLALTGVGSVNPDSQIAFTFGALVAVYSLVYAGKRLVLWTAQRWTRVVILCAVLGIVFLGLLTAIAAYVPQLAPARFAEFVREVGDVFAPTCSAQAMRAVPIPILPPFEPSDSPTQATLRELPPAYANVPVAIDHWDHFVGPSASIRVPDISRYAEPNGAPSFALSVVLTVVVSEHGRVLAAVPLRGPSDLFAEAVRIAHRWRFEPFLIDGRPSVVRIEAIGVDIDTAEKRGARIAFPEVNDWQSLRIRLRREVHGWGGPAYEFTIRGDGSISYLGHGGVALMERHCAVVPRAAVERLVEEFRRGEFFSLNDRYVAQASDVNSVELSISFDGRTKRVYQYGQMFLEGLPDAVIWLPHLTDYAVQSSRWTRGSRFTVPSLTAERWDFSSWSIANRTMVAGVAAFGDEAALGDLIRAGAPVYAEPEQILGLPTALEIAAARREIGMVRLLLATPAAWRRTALNIALALAARLGDVDTVDQLLKRDVSVEAPDRDKKTALMNAAEAGVPSVVERLLRADASVRAVDAFGRTALHWAVSWRNKELPVPPGVDRRRVVELLVAAGTNVDVRDSDGNTPLFSEWEDGEVGAAALIALGADVNAKNQMYGETPLMVCRNPKVTQMLLDAGANPYARNDENRTALDLARSRDGGHAVVAVLERWMAAHPERKAK